MTVPVNERCWTGRCPNVATWQIRWREGPGGNRPRREQLCDRHTLEQRTILTRPSWAPGRRDYVFLPHTARPLWPTVLTYDPQAAIADRQLTLVFA
jgi:hypothetical protein